MVNEGVFDFGQYNVLQTPETTHIIVCLVEKGWVVGVVYWWLCHSGRPALRVGGSTDHHRKLWSELVGSVFAKWSQYRSEIALRRYDIKILYVVLT